MAKRLIIILVLFLPSLAGAQVFRYQDLCKVGGQPATVQGLVSSNDLIGSYPGCTVNVFISGSGTPATIYSDSGLTPLANPFTADIVYGTYGFYAAAGCYDVVTSGAGMPAPQTASAICLATSVTAGTVTSVTQTNNASGLISVAIANPTTTPAFTFGLTQFGAHRFWGNGTGSTATPSASVIGVGDLPFTYSGNTTKLVTGGTISGTGVNLCTDASGNATTTCPALPGYNTVQDEGSALTQRVIINFIGTGVSCADNSGSLRTDCTISSTGITGSVSSGTFPVGTGANVVGDSNLANVVGPPTGVLYSSGGTTWQLDVNSLTWNSGVSGGSNILITNTHAFGSNNSAAGIIIKSPSATGSACGGAVQLKSGDTNGAVNNSTISADGACSNGFGAVGGSVTITGGSTAASNSGGDINLNPGTGGFSNGSVKVTQSLTIGSGTPIKKVLSTTATLDFGSLVSIGCEDLTITVTGAAVGDTVSLGVPNGSVPSATFTYTGWVSAADTVTIRGCALVSGDPASGTFRATVVKF